MKNSSSRTSESSTQFELPHSPLRLGSSPLSDSGDPFHSTQNSPDIHSRDNSRAIVVVEASSTQYSHAPPSIPDSEHWNPPANDPPVVLINHAMRGEPPPPATNMSPPIGGGVRRVDGGGRGRIVSSSKEMARKAALGFRLSEVVLCLISFSVMAADKTQGWSGDSFDRYKEYRYCLSVNVIAFVYAGFQACDLAYQLVKRRHLFNHHLRFHFDFFMDQVLAYLLISSSSSAATRVDDWQSNWGKDEFTEMASASVALAFLAFIAFAISSLVSGYNLCTLYP
ncbi:CASP-like protein 4A3 [Gastrolobium bilobum]|uniref:CASP-like protein 4A3 n=1 Tax=Gastrolobium bilobum TaxID=150636 RepID=UPI002AB154A8|nr:CASP-like protein 4A3 [Gastrolobium bilobum]